MARRSCLRKSFDTLKPLLIQFLLFGYIAAFHLPALMVGYLGTGGNFAFLRGALRAAYGKDKSEWSSADSMAAMLGPSQDDCKTRISEASVADGTPDGSVNALSYSPDVLTRAQSPATSFLEKTRYYTDGAGTQKWQKSLETLAWLHNIEAEDSNSSDIRRRRSSSSAIFEPVHSGSLRAPATVLWGQKDQACTQRICLDGISDYLAKGSQVVLLPRTGHWTAVEKESRIAFGRVIEWFVDGGDIGSKGDVASVVKEVYDDATLLTRK
jgi:pimeloyl-ACP methyl ester carboxylesterase